MPVEAYVELGAKRAFAGALDWPGWCRSGRDANGALDTGVSGDGILELPNDVVTAQFFGAAVSPDGTHVALSTNNNQAGARVVVLELGS